MDKEQLINILSPVADLKVNNISGNARFEFTNEGNLYVRTPTHEYALDKGGRKDLFKYIGFNDKLAKRLSIGLANQAVTELYQRGGETSALVREDNEIVGFAPVGRYRSVPVPAMIDNIETAIGSGVEYNRGMLMPNFDTRIEVVGDKQEQVQQGDYVRGGVAVRFNPLGITNPLIQTFGLRLICTNGLTAHTVLESYELGMDKDITNSELFEWVQDTVSDAYQSIENTAIKWRAMAQDKINPADRPQLIGSLARNARLRGEQATALWAQATEEPPETAWDVANLMTWLSSHVLENDEQVVRVQDTVAMFVDEQHHTRFCPTCKRVGS